MTAARAGIRESGARDETAKDGGRDCNRQPSKFAVLYPRIAGPGRERPHNLGQNRDLGNDPVRHVSVAAELEALRAGDQPQQPQSSACTTAALRQQWSALVSVARRTDPACVDEPLLFLRLGVQVEAAEQLAVPPS